MYSIYDKFMYTHKFIYLNFYLIPNLYMSQLVKGEITQKKNSVTFFVVSTSCLHDHMFQIRKNPFNVLCFLISGSACFLE